LELLPIPSSYLSLYSWHYSHGGLLVVKALLFFFGDGLIDEASSSSSIALSIECDLNLLDKLQS
jgi:hypothetical protein